MDPFWSENEVGPEWADLVRMAAEAWGAPAALLRLSQPSGAHASFSHGCTNALEWVEEPGDENEEYLLVPDTRKDPRWVNHPALRVPGFCFLAAITIPSGDGESCGSLWIFGEEPRLPGPWERGALRLLRRQAMALRRLEEQIHTRRNEELHYRTILESLMEGVVFLDTGGHILACNPSAERILDLRQDQMTGRRSVDSRFTAIHEDGSPFPDDAHPSIRALLTGKPQMQVVQGIQSTEGRRVWISVNAQPLQHPWEEKPHGAVVSIFDITRMKEVEERLRKEATRDSLTGLYSRGHFMERLGVALKSAKRHGDSLCLAMADLDDFKSVNDRFGHQTGDQALSLMGRLLMEGLRGEDLAGRYGGDEFCILFPRSGLSEARACLERIRVRLSGEILESGGSPVCLTASFGVASMTSLVTGEEVLFQTADSALYRAKRPGRNRVEMQDG
jgi:diguanylate cyclase (GGDEF)-like protein/PAS domain S-box-containing protein